MTGSSRIPPQLVDRGIHQQSPLRRPWDRTLGVVFIVIVSVGYLVALKLLQWLGLEGNLWTSLLGLGFMAWCIAWASTHNKPRAMPSVRATRAMLIAIAAVAGILVSGFGMAHLMASRYETYSADGVIYRVDRLMGPGRACDGVGCWEIGTDVAYDDLGLDGRPRAASGH